MPSTSVWLKNPSSVGIAAGSSVIVMSKVALPLAPTDTVPGTVTVTPSTSCNGPWAKLYVRSAPDMSVTVTVWVAVSGPVGFSRPKLTPAGIAAASSVNARSARTTPVPIRVVA